MNWKLVLMRILVNGLAIAATAIIVPGFNVAEGNILIQILLLGFIFGLLNALVKPIIQFFTLSLLFTTYGFIVIIINAVMLLILDWLLPNLLQISSIWAALAAGIIVGIVGIFLENLLGLTPPIVDDPALAKKLAVASKSFGGLTFGSAVTIPARFSHEGHAEVLVAGEGVEDTAVSNETEDPLPPEPTESSPVDEPPTPATEEDTDAQTQ